MKSIILPNLLCGSNIESETNPARSSASIYIRYTRNEALDRGLLVDVTDFARRLLHYPCDVAISGLLYDRFVQWDPQDSLLQVYQNQSLRLLSLLIVAKTAVYQQARSAQAIQFVFSAIPRDGLAVSKVAQKLKLVLGFSEQQFPVLTIVGEHDMASVLIPLSGSNEKGAL